jgi:dihydroorotate dehydrogenase
LALVAVGGFEIGDDAWERITAGATLVQAYTGFIYSRPLWPHRIHSGLPRRARDVGLTSIQQAVSRARALAPRPALRIE